MATVATLAAQSLSGHRTSSNNHHRMSAKWQRPSLSGFPCVYQVFEGRRPLPDGSVPRFTVQDVPDDMHDQVIDHMCEHFLRDEPLCSYTKLREDPVSLQEIRDLWKTMLEQRAALIVFVDDGKGGPRRIAGANVTGVTRKADKAVKAQYKGEAMLKVIAALDYIEALAEPDVFSRYGVSEYLTALGLSVGREFRGQGLGDALLKARWPLCRNIGVKLTVTVFSATVSQILARRVGFEDLVEVQYNDYSEPAFKNRDVPCMILMAAPIK